MIERKRILVVGSRGRLGSLLCARYSASHEVIGLARDQLDLGKPDSVRDAIDAVDFDLLILAAALTAVDHCETNEAEAFSINAEGPELLANRCADKGARMIHFGSDYVFGGDLDRPYTEEDETRPISVYGASKLAGELAVAGASERHLVVRVSWLFGPGGPAFPEWIIRQAEERDEVAIPADKIACPTHAGDLVDLLEPLLFRDDANGIVHLCNSKPCTWQEWGQRCIDVALAAGRKLKTDRIGGTSLDSIPAFVAKRPPNSAMDTSKYTRLTGVVPRPWQDAVADHLGVSNEGRLLREGAV